LWEDNISPTAGVRIYRGAQRPETSIDDIPDRDPYQNARKRQAMLRISRAVGIMLAFVLALSAGQARAQATPGVPYTVDITGEPSGDVSDLIERASQLLALRDRPPPSLAALGRRVRDDEDRIRAILESEGYYDGTVSSRIEEKGDATTVIVALEAGTRYTLRELYLDIGPRADDETLPVLRQRAYLRPAQDLAGRPARAGTIIAAEESALAALRAGGFAFARRGDRRVDVDPETHTIGVVLPVRLGPDAVFGAVRLSGETDVSQSFVDSYVTWERGELYDATKLERLRLDLVTAGLYSSVRVEPDARENMPNGDPLDIIVTLRDALHRTFGAGAKFARDKGFGASAFWEHRNILGGGEKLRLAVDATEIDQTASAAFTKPGFLRSDQTLRIATELRHNDTDAYREWGSISTAALERRLSEYWTVSGGVSLDVADITDNGASRQSYLAGLPITATWTTTDPLTPLDPVQGWRIALSTTPYAGAFGGSVAFLKSEAQGSVYVPLDYTAKTVIAARLKVGSIVGEPTNDIPANRRFYGGGGGSIRGYGYQLVSPLAPDLTPTGGRSLIEASLEARYHITDTIGIVPFVDAGMASLSSVPGADAKFFSAVGLGGRYYTPVGPLRVDVAMPLNRRAGVDKAFQFYVSFGQAF
jgi:translocation and assembly module TamA